VNREVTLSRHVVWDRIAGGEKLIFAGLKSTDSKTVPSEKAIRVIQEWCQEEGISDPADYLFFWKGEPVSYRQIQYHYDKAFRALGLKMSGTHIARHAAAKQAQSIGGTRHAQRLLGHENASTTDGYLGVRDEDFRGFQSKMDEQLLALQS
jgi:site-specific recombinase XerC